MLRRKTSGGKKFSRLGGSYHLRLRQASDLLLITDIDEPFWMTTSAPLDGFACDQRFIYFMDLDGNRRIRCQEMKDAIRWLFDRLKDHTDIGLEQDILRLDAIDVSGEEGLRIRRAAERILCNVGDSQRETISLVQARDHTTILASASTNGDGIIPPTASSDPAVSAFITDVITNVRAETDAGGLQGLTEEITTQFVQESTLYLEWYGEGFQDDGRRDERLFPRGDRTRELYDVFMEIKEPLDHYFLLCSAIPFLETLDAENRPVENLSSATYESKETLEAALGDLPLAKPDHGGVLHLDRRVNPLFRETVRSFFKMIQPQQSTIEDFEITHVRWLEIKVMFKPYHDWFERKPVTTVSKLGPEKLETYVKGNYIEHVQKLIEQDKEVGEELASIEEVEKLILYQRWLLPVANNFVSFPDLYETHKRATHKRALFESGTLVLDGRTFRLCLPVDGRAAHKEVARHSGLYLMYVRISQRKEDPGREIVVAVTSGNAGRICVGKKGIFYSYTGQEFDAEVVDYIQNPISLVEAFFHPFKRLGEIIEKQIEKIIGQSERELESVLDKRSNVLSRSIGKMETKPGLSPVEQIAAQDKNRSVTASPAQERNFFRDLIVGVSLSVAAIGSSFAFVTKMMSEVHLNHIIATLLAGVVLILGPIIILTMVKLHRRDIGMLLEASGWAINGRMRLTRKLARSLSSEPSHRNSKTIR